MGRRNELTVHNRSLGNCAQEDRDSDQSISEEEGLEDEWTVNTISLAGAPDNEGKMQVLSQLEVLRDSYERHSTEKDFISSLERKAGLCIDDEVENPLSSDEDGPICCPKTVASTRYNEGIIEIPSIASVLQSDEEIISDDEKINPPKLKFAREKSGGTWSQASEEVKALVMLNENSGCSSSHGGLLKEHKCAKGGGRTKAKPKYLFRFNSHKRDPSLVVSDGNWRSVDTIPQADETVAVAVAHRNMDKFMAECQLDLHETESLENQMVPSELTHKNDFNEYSVAEFLNRFERSSELQGSSELEMEKRQRKDQMDLERNTSALDDGNLDENDSPEDLDSEPFFPSENEGNPQSLQLIVPRKTMAEHFHEAFGTVSVTDERPHLALPGPLCNGIYGKLQQIMRREKEQDMNYLKNLSPESSFKGEKLSISVRILSRSLEAKLIVCSCTSVGDGKNSCSDNDLRMKMEGVPKTSTVIFNPRICSDAELEVGNLICIHSPWKEVPVKGKDEVVLLCSYFSQVQC